MQKLALSLLVCSGIISCAAQTSAPGSNWDHLKALPSGTRMHVHGDRMARTCTLDRVTDDELVCSKGRLVDTARYTFPRGEVAEVKLTRYTLSTLGGLGIGAGAGAGIAGAAIRSDSFKSLGVAVFGVGGGLAGALALGPADAFRGPLVYRRLKP